jgi:enoyl-CoA hydratase/carnithine racemase
MEMALSGDDYTSEQVQKFGLINRVVDSKEELLKESRKLAENISSNSPLVVQATKHIIDYSSSTECSEE